MGWALKQLHPLSTPNSKIKSLGFGGRQRLGSVFLLCPLLCGLGKLVNLSDAQLHPLQNGDYMNTHVGALKAAAPTTHSARPSGEPSPHTWLSFLHFWWAGGAGAAPGWQTEEGSYPRPSRLRSAASWPHSGPRRGDPSSAPRRPPARKQLFL